jgi:hypothetical protein
VSSPGACSADETSTRPGLHAGSARAARRSASRASAISQRHLPRRMRDAASAVAPATNESTQAQRSRRPEPPGG